MAYLHICGENGDFKVSLSTPIYRVGAKFSESCPPSDGSKESRDLDSTVV